ncbi:hypothetical protein NG800_010960 [Epilithonimonas ginsengisoli]|uniref:CHAT domain-containing protein n=2 Tax=Chryseobacterium group TaxID=2782232 RepID=A0ABU4JIB8_9FLAO|nr:MULTISPECIES: hypothetical protein [Chryseobacterium group]MDW8549433.1 hypothetical protein [Epilithonimonas ginsengisoli]OAH71685.1 hypothetical protein AXA65_11995 [Chryseobacterium sp. FP211-J200]HBV17517.1 hypothetical protein [Chryseobacterium carnipullorum]
MTGHMQVNNFYFIECIDPNESKSTNALALYNDIVSKMNIFDSDIDTEYFEIETKTDFLNRLDWIEGKDITNKNVLIHIYLHGSKNRDGLLANDRILITWQEILEKTRSINVKSHNKLFLILALCHGKHIGEKLNIKLKSPFNSLIASNYEEYVDDIYNLFQKFYNNLVFDNNVVRAFTEAQTEKDNYFFKNTHKIIEEVFKKYVQEREQILPKLYQEFLQIENAPKISFKEYDILNKRTLPEILQNMENEFFIR